MKFGITFRLGAANYNVTLPTPTKTDASATTTYNIRSMSPTERKRFFDGFRQWANKAYGRG